MIKKTPIRIQVNPIECGAVVLGIILGYYKHQLSYSELNNLVGISRYGTDARALMRAAGLLGFKAYAQKILVSDLKKTHSLSVLYVDNSHFVVYEGYFWGRFYINDPALGRYSLSAEELRRRLSGMQIILEPTDRLRKIRSENYLDNFNKNMIGSSAIFGALVGVLVVILVSNLALTITEPIKYLYLISFFLVALTIFSIIIIKIFNLKLKNLYAQSLNSWLLTQISQTGSGFFTTRPFARFARALKNISMLNINYPKYFIKIIIGTISLIIILGLVFIYWPFALMSVALCLLSFIMTRQKDQSKDLSLPDGAQAYEHYGDLSAMGQNAQLFNTQIALTARVFAHFDFAYKSSMSALVLGVFLPLIFYWANLQIEHARLATLEVYAVLILTIILSFLATHLAKIMSKPEEEHDSALISEIGDLALSARNNKINNSKYLFEINNGDFIYPGEKKAIFEDFNLILERAKFYTIDVAPLAGVSTLLKLVGQKLQWSSGEQKLESNNLRIALIDDEADLFDGSLFENIRLFDRHISEDQVVLALEQASVEELFYQRPMGLLSPIHAHGANVSGGQKKRLLLARALVYKPDLIILDDFFETLEPELALKILKNLRALNTTVIFSGQRIKERELADKIITWSAQL